MQSQSIVADVPYFPFPLQRAADGNGFAVINHLMGAPLKIDDQAALVLRLADGRETVSGIASRVAELFPDAGGMEAVLPAVADVLRRMTADELVWWRDVPVEPMPVRPPLNMFCEITAACNLRCRHCVVAAGTRERNELSTERWLELLQEFAEFGVQSVAFSGGEPLLHPRFAQLANRTRELGMAVQVATNGTLVTPALALWLSELDAEVQVSLDGASADSHNRMRPGADAFGGAIRGIRALVAAGHEITVGTVVSRLNVDEIPAVVDLTETLGVAHFRLIPFVPKGRGAEFGHLELTPSEMRSVTRYLRDRRRTGKIHIMPLEFEEFTDDCACAQAFDPNRELGCSGAVAYGTITPSGTVLPCHFFDGVRADSVANAPFAEVWRRSRFLNYFRHLTVADLHGACRTCGWLERCGGSCRAVNFAKGDLFGGNLACWIAEDLESKSKACPKSASSST